VAVRGNFGKSFTPDGADYADGRVDFLSVKSAPSVVKALPLFASKATHLLPVFHPALVSL
jgi:hypothetical protein